MYDSNHYWNVARHAAIDRDEGACVRCGWRLGEWYDHLLHNGQFVLWSRGNLLREGEGNWLEVNHIIPREGRGYGTGCWHHLEGLESLCHRCHVKVTNRQRVARSRKMAS